MTFDEDSAYNKSKNKPIEVPEESKAPKIHDTTMNEETQEEYQEFEEYQEPVRGSTSGEESSQEETCLGT